MKKQLICKYIAHKLAKFDEAPAEAKRVFGDEVYFELVKTSLISEFPKEFWREIEAVLRKRFSLKKHKCVFYNEPTVEQWVADLTGLFSEDEIYTVFAQSSGLSEEAFRTKTYGDNILNRPFLEEIVEMLEAATGKRLLDVGYLTYDDKYTYADIAKHFSA